MVIPHDISSMLSSEHAHNSYDTPSQLDQGHLEKCSNIFPYYHYFHIYFILFLRHNNVVYWLSWWQNWCLINCAHWIL